MSSSSRSNLCYRKYTSFRRMSFRSTSISSKRSSARPAPAPTHAPTPTPLPPPSPTSSPDSDSSSRKACSSSSRLRLSSSQRLARMGASPSLILSWRDLGMMSGRAWSGAVGGARAGAARESWRLRMMSMMLMQLSTFLKFFSSVFMRFSCARTVRFFIISNRQYSCAKFSPPTSRPSCPAFCSRTSRRMCSYSPLSVMPYAVEEQQQLSDHAAGRSCSAETSLQRMNSSATNTPRCLFQISSPHRDFSSYSYASCSRTSVFSKLCSQASSPSRVSSGYALRSSSFFRSGLPSKRNRKKA